MQLGRRGEVGVEGAENAEEPFLLLGPGERLGVVPRGFALGHRKRPVKEIAHVGKDLDWSSAGAVESAKDGRRASSARAVR